MNASSESGLWAMVISRTWLEMTDSGDWVLTSDNNLSATTMLVLAIATNLPESLCDPGCGYHLQGVARKEGKYGKGKRCFRWAVSPYSEPGEAGEQDQGVASRCA